MTIGIINIIIHIPWAHSLKEKRMIVKSICAKVRGKFNVSIAEVEEQDIHQIIGLGIACVTNETTQADSIMDHVINYIESNIDGEIVKVEREII